MTSQLIYWLEYIVNFTGTIAYVFFLYLLIRLLGTQSRTVAVTAV